MGNSDWKLRVAVQQWEVRCSCLGLLWFEALGQVGFDAFDTWEAGGELGGQGLSQFVVG
jgi:hypothetical protein